MYMMYLVSRNHICLCVSGVIRVDGHDLTEVNVASLRRHIGVVSQQPQVREAYDNQWNITLVL